MTGGTEDWFAGTDEPRTPSEATFIQAVRDRADGLALVGITKADTQCWLFDDDKGIWMLLHADLAIGDVVFDVLRVDYADGIIGGRSPGLLSWDAEKRYADCGVDIDDPALLAIRASGPPDFLAQRAVEWFTNSARVLIGQRRDLQW